jgi:hypothetical protein
MIQQQSRDQQVFVPSHGSYQECSDSCSEPRAEPNTPALITKSQLADVVSVLLTFTTLSQRLLPDLRIKTIPRWQLELDGYPPSFHVGNMALDLEVD